MTRSVLQMVNWGAALTILTTLSAGCMRPDFTLTISGENEAEGAEVWVDDRLVGSMKKLAGTGSHFMKAFPKRELTVEVRKEGYRAFRTVVTVAWNVQEHHVYAKLAPIRDTNHAGPKNQATGPSGAVDPAPPPTPTAPSNTKIPVCPD